MLFPQMSVYPYTLHGYFRSIKKKKFSQPVIVELSAWCSHVKKISLIFAADLTKDDS